MVGIVIPCLNEEKYIPKLLEDIRNQTVKPDHVVIADAGSNDGTLKILKEWKRKVKFKVSIVKGGLPGFGRNRGARHLNISDNDFIMFLDADVSIDSDFIERVIYEMKKRNLLCATCFNIPYYRPWEKGYKNKFIRVIDTIIYVCHNFGLIISKIIKFPVATATCIIVRKDVFNKINGFNESLQCFEDSDFVNRCAKICKYGVLTNIKVYVSTRRFDRKTRLFALKIFFFGFVLRLLGIKNKMRYWD